MNKVSKLSEREELLLLQFMDDECGFWERRRARRLISRNGGAQIFIDDMRAIGDDARRVAEDESFQAEYGEVDLWSSISSRIEQEEHAEVFLGKRSVPAKEYGKHFGLSEVIWGISGAAVTAMLAFFVVGSNPGEMPNIPTEIASLAASSSENVIPTRMTVKRALPQVQPVVASQDRIPTRKARIVVRKYQKPITVDWMKSDGSVQIIHEPTAQAPIIWVTRRKPVSKSVYSRLPRTSAQTVRSRREATPRFPK